MAPAPRLSAVELFNERATEAMEGFVLSDTDVPDILEICRGLDGMPLALELAAAQIEVFGVKGLAAALEDRLAILTRGLRSALPRHQALRATRLVSPTQGDPPVSAVKCRFPHKFPHKAQMLEMPWHAA